MEFILLPTMLPVVACNALFYSITLFSTYISSTQNIFKFIVEHKDSDYAVFQHQLELTDLTNKMEITSALIKDVVRRWTGGDSHLLDKSIIVSKDETDDAVVINIHVINLSAIPEPIKLSIISLLTINNKISDTLNNIHCKIKTHEVSYMKSFIKIKIGDDIDKIVSMTALFNQRLELLLQLLKIYY
jgi:hypothetical protein